MNYQELYKKYQDAIKFRELKSDDNFKRLEEIFNKKIMNSINLNTHSSIIPYLSGIKEVFMYAEHESEKVDFYREELDRVVAKELNQ